METIVRNIFPMKVFGEAHMEKTHGVPQNPLFCPDCEYQSPNQSSFLNHQVQAHECQISEVNDLDLGTNWLV